MNTEYCLILAAGRGSRLSHRTDSKPLVPVHGYALIEHIVMTVRGVGLSRIFVVSGYNGKKLRAFLDRLALRERIEIHHVVNDEWQRGNGLSVHKAKDLLEDPFFLLMGDHLFHPEIVQEMNRIRLQDGEVHLAVDYNLSNPLVDLADVTRVAVEDGLIVDIGKGISHYSAFDTGVFLCTPSIFESLEESMARRHDDSLSGGVRCLARTRRKAKVFDIEGRFWLDIDDENDFTRAICSEEIRKFAGRLSSRAGSAAGLDPEEPSE